MKVACALLSLAAVVLAQTNQPQPKTRDLPADVLRDFPTSCFASTRCELFEPGKNWTLAPFCGVAECVLAKNAQGAPVGLIERVTDCGIQPKDNKDCKNVNAAAEKEAYPACCPKYECTKGAKLEYPTEEELRQLAQQAAANPQPPQGSA